MNYNNDFMIFGRCYKLADGKIGIVSSYEGNVNRPTAKSGSDARKYFLTNAAGDITYGVYDNYGNPLGTYPTIIGVADQGIRFKPKRY